jgi:hypothetical protein
MLRWLISATQGPKRLRILTAQETLRFTTDGTVPLLTVTPNDPQLFGSLYQTVKRLSLTPALMVMKIMTKNMRRRRMTMKMLTNRITRILILQPVS